MGYLNSGSLAERRLARRDGAAVAWFESRGQRIEAKHGVQVFADALRSSSFEIARVWHTPAQVLHQSPGSAMPGLLAVVQVDGETTVTSITGAEPVTLTPGMCMVVDLSEDFTLTSTAPAARVEIKTNRVLFPHTPLSGAWVVGESGYGGALVAAVNAALSSDVDPGDPAFADLRSAVEHLLRASFHETSSPVQPRGRQDSLYTAAMELIRSESRDPRFSASVLARRLSMSERTLRRALSRHGTSVRAEIARERARSAHALIADASPHSADDLTSIANSTGYTSVRWMRESLRKHGLPLH